MKNSRMVVETDVVIFPMEEIPKVDDSILITQEKTETANVLKKIDNGKDLKKNYINQS